jgi:hypothetical protein
MCVIIHVTLDARYYLHGAWVRNAYAPFAYLLQSL